jgi:hypothetical protein
MHVLPSGTALDCAKVCVDLRSKFSTVFSASPRGGSSIGRAPALQAGGRRFDSDPLHKQSLTRSDGIQPILDLIRVLRVPHSSRWRPAIDVVQASTELPVAVRELVSLEVERRLDRGMPWVPHYVVCCNPTRLARPRKCVEDRESVGPGQGGPPYRGLEVTPGEIGQS